MTAFVVLDNREIVITFVGVKVLSLIIVIYTLL